MTSVDELEMEELKRDTEGGAAVRVQATHSFLFFNHFEWEKIVQTLNKLSRPPVRDSVMNLCTVLLWW
jgi:hypothetical protein